MQQNVAMKHKGAGNCGVAKIHAHLYAVVRMAGTFPERNLNGIAQILICLAAGALIEFGFGFFKGMYDANIFASLHDVVSVERRGVAVGIMNSLAWLGGGVAPIAIAVAAGRYGMSAAISATAGSYLLIGMLMLWEATRSPDGTPTRPGRDRDNSRIGAPFDGL